MHCFLQQVSAGLVHHQQCRLEFLSFLFWSIKSRYHYVIFQPIEGFSKGAGLAEVLAKGICVT